MVERPHAEDDDEQAPRRRTPIPEEVSEEMRVDDIVHALQHMGFVRGQGLLLLDRGVRDYLVRTLRGR